MKAKPIHPPPAKLPAKAPKPPAKRPAARGQSESGVASIAPEPETRKKATSVPTESAVVIEPSPGIARVDPNVTLRPPGLPDGISRPDLVPGRISSIDLDVSVASEPPPPHESSGRDPFQASLPVHVTPFGRYHLLGRLAVGGMAEIFLANERTDGGASRHVVIKIARPHLSELSGFEDMFMNEGRVAMRLTHPNICHVYEFGMERGRHFMALEWVNGVSLREMARRAQDRGQKLPLEVVVKIISQVADALDYAHRLRDTRGRSLNIVHRDVSPHNVMVSYDGVVKLLDFGVAKGDHTKETTQSGTVKGKFNYMSPQQCTGRTVDGRADVFALGVCLWEALTGRNLFKRDTQYETFKAIIEDDVPKLSGMRDDVPKELDAILDKAMAKTLDARYRTAGEFHDDLARFLQQRGEVVSSSRLARYMENLFEPEIAAGPTLEASPEIFSRIAPPESLPMADSKGASRTSGRSLRRRWMVPMITGALGVFAGVLLIAAILGPGQSADVDRPPVESGEPAHGPAALSHTVPTEPAEPTMAEVEPTVAVAPLDGPAGAEIEPDVIDHAEGEEETEGADDAPSNTMRRTMRRRVTMRSMTNGFVTDPGS
jgi:serine/threonine-protein kinase